MEWIMVDMYCTFFLIKNLRVIAVEDYQRILRKRYANFDLINPSCTDELIDRILSEYQPLFTKKNYK